MTDTSLHRSFKRPEQPPVPDGEFKPKEGPSFDLGGVGQLTGKPWELTLRCVAEPPAAAFDDLARSVGTDARGQLVFNNVSLLRFFDQVVVPEDEQTFRDLVNDKDRAVQIEELGEVLMWLAGLYTERPTSPPSPSGNGRSGGSTT